MKDIYIQKLFLKGQQRAKLLVANPEFQKEVKEIRKKFKIPLDGFKDQESNQRWYRDFYQSENESFHKIWGKRRHEIVELQKAKKFGEAEELRKELNNLMPINAFRIAIKNILKKYKLPLRWQESIKRYILSNKIEGMGIPGGIMIAVNYDKDTLLPELSIEIRDDTTIEDIKQAWPDIEFHKQQLHSYVSHKFQPIKNFGRGQAAYNLKLSGKTYSEIADVLSKRYDKTYSYDDVASFIKRYKQKIGINKA